MGGSVAVLIRLPDGTEYCGDRWTNPIPGWISYPEIYEGAETLIAYIKAGEEECPVFDKVTPSEYGLLIIDAQRKKIYSRQDYCGVMSRSCVFLDAADAKHLLEIIERGWMTSYECIPFEGSRKPFELTPPEIEEFKAWLKRGAKEWEPEDAGGIRVKHFERGMITCGWKVPGWEVDEGPPKPRAWKIWPEVTAYLKENDWKMPVATQAEVDAEFNSDEVEEDEEDEDDSEEEEEPVQVQ